MSEKICDDLNTKLIEEKALMTAKHQAGKDYITKADQIEPAGTGIERKRKHLLKARELLDEAKLHRQNAENLENQIKGRACKP